MTIETNLISVSSECAKVGLWEFSAEFKSFKLFVCVSKRCESLTPFFQRMQTYKLDKDSEHFHIPVREESGDQEVHLSRNKERFASLPQEITTIGDTGTNEKGLKNKRRP